MKKASPNNYYLKYNLVGDPFPEQGPDKVLFLSSELNSRLEQAKDKISNTQKLVLITSAPGGGKTTMCQHLGKLKETNWVVCRVQGNEKLSIEALAHRIIQQVLPEDAGETTQSVNKLHKYLEHSYRHKTVPVFIIDDAHKLPFDTLQFILQLSDLRYNETLFRFVLFANETIYDMLEKPALDELCVGILHVITIPPLTEEQTNTYIEYRLSSFGEINNYPFTDDKLNYIYRASGGLPGGINLLARESMQSPSSKGGFLKLTGLFLFTIAIASLSFASAYLLFNNTNNEQIQTAALPLPPKQSLADESPALAQKTPVIDIDKSLSLKLSNLSFSLPKPAKVVASPASQPVEKVLSAPKPVAKETTPKNQTKAVEPKVEKVISRTDVNDLFADIHSNDWFREQAAGTYVLQLISASEKKTVRKVINRHTELQDNLAGYVSYTKSGKPRYMLVFGPYRSKKSAANGVANLPAELKSLKPWPRTVAGIVKNLDKRQ